MGQRLPAEYRISQDRVPVVGSSITEGINLDELTAYQAACAERDAPRPGTMAYKFARAVLPHLFNSKQGEEGHVPTNRS